MASKSANTTGGSVYLTLDFHLRNQKLTYRAYDRYANQAALEAHVKSPAGQELGKKFKEEDLVAEPMKIMLTKTVAGFDSKL